MIIHHQDGSVSEVIYTNRDAQMHRKNGPAHIEWRKDGTKLGESWHLNDERHRLDGPAYTTWNNSGTIRSEHYYTHGTWHSPNKSSFQDFVKRMSVTYVTVKSATDSADRD